MAQETSLRKAIAPSTPLSLELEGEQGKFVIHVKLAFDFNAYALIEARTGLNILKNQLFTNINATNIVVMLWAALQRYNPDYVGDEGLEVIGTYVSIENFGVVAQALKAAFLASLSKEARESIEAKEKATAAGTPAPADPQPAETTQA